MNINYKKSEIKDNIIINFNCENCKNNNEKELLFASDIFEIKCLHCPYVNKIISLFDCKIEDLEIDYHKCEYHVKGIINDRYKIIANNGGEYKSELSYKDSIKFTINSFDFDELIIIDTNNDKIIFKN